MNMTPRLGLILLFEGDYRRVNATIKNVSEFTAVSAVLKNGDNDVTGTYVSTSPAYQGNVLITAIIGGAASIPPGSYRYFISGTYGGKKRTWYWDVLVLPKDLSLLSAIDLNLEDYNPLIEEITSYEGDNFAKEIVVSGVAFSAVDAQLRSFADNVTLTYCTGTAQVSPDFLDTIISHNIGGAALIPAGDYGYFVTGTYDNAESKSTWYFRVKSLPKQGVL